MNIHTNQNSRMSAMKITVMNQWLLLASYSSEQVGLVQSNLILVDFYIHDKCLFRRKVYQVQQ